MNILVFAATNHKYSINQKLVDFCSVLLAKNNEIFVRKINMIDYEIPLYRQDIEIDEGIPEKAHDFYKQIKEADALIISFAEHNGSYTAVYKNLIDWVSRINNRIYQGKLTLVLSATPGPSGGRSILAQVKDSAEYFGMDIGGIISFPNFHKNFDKSNGQPISQEIRDEIHKFINALCV